MIDIEKAVNHDNLEIGKKYYCKFLDNSLNGVYKLDFIQEIDQQLPSPVKDGSILSVYMTTKTNLYKLLTKNDAEYYYTEGQLYFFDIDSLPKEEYVELILKPDLIKKEVLIKSKCSNYDFFYAIILDVLYSKTIDSTFIIYLNVYNREIGVINKDIDLYEIVDIDEKK